MDNNNIQEKFGKRIAELRKKNNMSQEELAFAAGLNRTHIGMIERAEKNISLTTIEKIAKGLNIPIGSIFNFE